jgi:hypothetical protein
MLCFVVWCGAEVKSSSAVSEKDRDREGGHEQAQAGPAPFQARMLAQTERIVTVHSPDSIRALQGPGEGGSEGGGGGKPATPSERRQSVEMNSRGGGRERATQETACVICSLVENAYLYLTIDGVETQLHAEALVHVSALFLSGECMPGEGGACWSPLLCLCICCGV